MYRRMIARLVILASLVMGSLFLAQPQPAYADDCIQQCLPDYQNCVAQGELGCQEIYLDCLCSCRGTC